MMPTSLQFYIASVFFSLVNQNYGNINQIAFFFFKGATIKRDEQTGAIVVARIMRGGAADRSGKVSLFSTSYSSSITQKKMR